MKRKEQKIERENTFSKNALFLLSSVTNNDPMQDLFAEHLSGEKNKNETTFR